MKLRNKKTGEIADQVWWDNEVDELCINSNKMYFYASLAELTQEWEDVEEPKEHYFITEYGGVYSLNEYEGLNNVANPEDYRAIGNYFETKEEAEKAVEKLKAWKRLKDKGFEFDGVAGICNEIYFKANEPFTHIMVDEYTAVRAEKEYSDDLMLLFGGEE